MNRQVAKPAAPIDGILGQLRLPVIAAPMFLVSNPAMVLACCAEGIMGSFPAHTTRTPEILAEWFDQVDDGLARLRDRPEPPAPYAVNLVVHETNPRLASDLAGRPMGRRSQANPAKQDPELLSWTWNPLGAVVSNSTRRPWRLGARGLCHNTRQ